MKIKLDTQSFLDALEKARTALPKKTIIPITDYFLVDVLPDKATITATNVESTISVTTQCKAEGAISFCIPGKLLYATVKLLREPDFIINTSKYEKKTTVDLICGKAKYTFGCFVANEFPQVVHDRCEYTASFFSDVFKDTVQAVSKFVSEDESRPALMSVLISNKDQDIVFAAASHMSMGRYHNKPHSITKWKDILVSPALSPIIEKCFSDKEVLDVSHNEKKVFIQNESIILSSVASALSYPDIDVFFKMEPETTVRFNTMQLRDSLERLKLFAPKENLIVNLQGKGGNVTMWASDDANNNSGEEEIAIDKDAEFFYAFNIDGFLGVISSFDNVEFDFNIFAESSLKHTFIYPLVGEGERDNKEFILMPSSGVKRD
jgi:DNA polymerase-3 subunit beta